MHWLPALLLGAISGGGLTGLVIAVWPPRLQRREIAGVSEKGEIEHGSP